MIILGSGSDVVHLGRVQSGHCSACDGERSFSLLLRYDFEDAYFVFGYVKQKEYVAVCDVCGKEHALDADEVERDLGRVPIPFMRRWGCVVLVLACFGLLVSLLVIGMSRR